MIKVLVLVAFILGIFSWAPTSTQGSECVESLQWQMMMAVNLERDAISLPPLAVAVQLVNAEQTRAETMAADSYFRHTLLNGSTIVTVLRADGNVAKTIGEVLGKTNSPAELSSDIVIKALMASNLHRETIMNPVFTRLGIGVAVGEDGMKYYAIVLTD